MHGWLRLWPGLPSLWIHGSWSGLLLALIFTAALNLLLVSSLVWTGLVLPRTLVTGWCILLGCCLAACVRPVRDGSHTADDRANSQDDLFPQALGEYLRGEWFSAEATLRELLERNPDDVDARLLLAATFRLSERFSHASAELRELGRREKSAKWLYEIRVEQNLAQEALQPATVPYDSLEKINLTPWQLDNAA